MRKQLYGAKKKRELISSADFINSTPREFFFPHFDARKYFFVHSRPHLGDFFHTRIENLIGNPPHINSHQRSNRSASCEVATYKHSKIVSFFTYSQPASSCCVSSSIFFSGCLAVSCVYMGGVEARAFFLYKYV